MKFRLVQMAEENAAGCPDAAVTPEETPVKSLVSVFFPQNGRTLTYFNDSFDLSEGDTVFVEGAMYGIQGRVLCVKRSFRIRPKDYMRVISKADTHVRGSFLISGDYLISDGPGFLTYDRVCAWYLPPEDEEEYVSGAGEDDSFEFSPDGEGPFEPQIIERGRKYFREHRVIYLEYSDKKVRALVRGEKVYPVEFEYSGGNISGMLCGCPYMDCCKHEYAAILQLRELLDSFADGRHEHFSAIGKYELMNMCLLGRGSGELSISI